MQKIGTLKIADNVRIFDHKDEEFCVTLDQRSKFAMAILSNNEILTEGNQRQTEYDEGDFINGYHQYSVGEAVR